MPLLSKLEKYLFYLLLISIPFQTRKILWMQEWNFSEWQAISLYGTDILLGILFILWALSTSDVKIRTSDVKIYDYFLLGFVGMAAISLKNTTSIYLSLFNLVKLIEFALFYFYLKSYALPKFGYLSALKAVVIGGTFQAIVAIIQFIKQSDLGLRLLGEPVLNYHLNGIASFYNLAGERVIRAYGTTPHSNILAAYLFLSIFSFYYLWIYERLDKKYFIAYGLMLLAFFFTFSRIVIGVLLLNFIIRIILIRFKFKKDYWNKKLAWLFLVTLAVVLLFSVFYWSDIVSRVALNAGDDAVQMRIFYNKESLESLDWFGVGIGNFVNWLMGRDLNIARYLYQPVHNIYLLIYSETGVAGISVFALFLVFLIRDYTLRTRLRTLRQYSLLLVFSSFLFLGLFDHFLWTLQQGRFILWGAIALLASDVV